MRPAFGKASRGFKLQRVPEPLDMLQIPQDAVITAINGVPVSDSKGLLETLTKLLGNRRALLVEFIAGDKAKAIEYRVM